MPEQAPCTVVLCELAGCAAVPVDGHMVTKFVEIDRLSAIDETSVPEFTILYEAGRTRSDSAADLSIEMLP